MGSMKIAVSQLLLCAILGFTGIDGKPPSAVLGGDSADPHEFPYQVSLSIYGQHFCGGTIIDSMHILTAGHCVDDDAITLKNVRIITGTNYVGNGSGRTYRIANVTLHPDYSTEESESWKNDMAIITLDEEIIFGRRNKAAKLPTHSTLANTKVVACGWGVTSHPDGDGSFQLKKLSMTVISNRKCKLPGPGDILDTHICAYSRKGSGVCSGDSGGPLLDNGTVVGVASFVIPCGKGFPDVFTRVYDYLDWINEVIEKDS